MLKSDPEEFEPLTKYELSVVEETTMLVELPSVLIDVVDTGADVVFKTAKDKKNH